MTLKGYMEAFIRIINPFEGLIILRLFFTVYELAARNAFRCILSMQNRKRNHIYTHDWNSKALVAYRGSASDAKVKAIAFKRV